MVELEIIAVAGYVVSREPIGSPAVSVPCIISLPDKYGYVDSLAA
jgi:hypothetical protein